MKIYTCEDCDRDGNVIPNTGCGEITHVIFDGYSFGDRMLEGVMFKASLNDNEVVVDTVEDWNTHPYLIGLNRDHWVKEAERHIKDLDIATCPNCGNDVDAQPKETTP